jgi:hypothetical protein
MLLANRASVTTRGTSYGGMLAPQPSLTLSVKLPGGQDRLRQMALYVSARCVSAPRMGLIKLNKIIWKADFDSYAARRRPVTGRPYQRLDLGPAPKEMPRILNDLLRDGALEYDPTDFGEGIIEQRPVASVQPNLSNFTEEDITFVEASISYYWDKTGMEASDDSHGIAWLSRPTGQPMYYELSFISDGEIGARQRMRLLQRGREGARRSL